MKENMLKKITTNSIISIISLFFLVLNPAQAITGVVTEAKVININCSNTYNKCYGAFSVSEKVFNLVITECLSTSGGSCSSSTQRNGYSMSNEQLLSSYINGFNAVETNLNDQFYSPVENCTVITTVGADEGTKKCDVFINKRLKDADGNYAWRKIAAGVVQTGLAYKPGANICPESNTTYLPGMGCTTNNSSNPTQRNVSSIPNNCDDCLTSYLNGYMFPQVGNPISVNSADKVERKQDLSFPIAFVRNYSSKRVGLSAIGSMGNGWKHNYDKKLTMMQVPNVGATGTYTGTLIFTEENDSEIIFTRLSATALFTPAFKDLNTYSLTDTGSGYILKTPNGNQETYNLNGQLTKLQYKNGYFIDLNYTTAGLSQIIDAYGHTLSFSYNGILIAQVVADNNDYMTYTYITNNLTNAVFNAIESTQYAYTSSRLTSITNPNNQLVSLFTYDTDGKALETKNVSAPNTYIHKYTMDYNNNKTTKGNGSTISYNMGQVNARSVVKSSTIVDGANSSSYGFTYDANGFPRVYTDGRNNDTVLNYSVEGLLQSITRPDGNQTSYSYYSDTKFVQSVSQTTSNGVRETSYEYDNSGNVIETKIQTNDSTRIWSNAYDSYGKIASLTEPNGNVTSYEYYADGDSVMGNRGLLKKVTDSAGNAIEVTSYDVRGNPTTVVDANNVTKTMTYDHRGRVKTETVGMAMNSYNYDLAGNLLNTTFANGLVLSFTYDQASRLTGVSDNNGNTQSYVLDADSDQATNISTFKNTVLDNVKNQVFDKLGRLTKLYKSNINEFSQFGYDGNSNVTSDKNANGYSNNFSYNNLDQVQSASGRDGYPSFTYDIDGNVKTATLNGKTTTYTFNDFGEMVSLISPETGNQSTIYNVSQNTMTRTDAKSIVHTYETDSLGRMKAINHVLGGLSETELFEYDSAVNGKGKIASVTNNISSIAYEYDELGRLSKKTQTVGAMVKDINYAYDNAGQLASMTYPSGLIVNYVYTNGLVTSVNVSGSVMGNVLEQATYAPFDNSFPKSYKFNSNKNRIIQFNVDDKLIALAIDGVLNQTFNMDAVGNFLSILDNIDGSKSLSSTYDSNNKLTLFTQNNQNYQPYYDSSFNRTVSYDGISNQNMNYYYDYNNRLTSYTLNGVSNVIGYDNNGNMLSEGSTSYAYDLKNNLKSVTKSGMTSNYAFNGLGQRVFKSSNGTNTYFLYDDATNLIGEYSDNGDPIIEHIYLNGVPIGVVQNHNIYYVHTDQLGTPRAITDGGNSIVWKWNNTNPFGKNLPSVQNIIYNKRFAGQYFDNESNLHYNYYRTYNPLIGRYIQSDPIGLAAGFNTYNYVEGNPLGATDSLGLDKNRVQFPLVHYLDNDANIFQIAQAKFANFYFMHKEEEIKRRMPTNNNLLTLGGHGSIYSLNGNPAFKIADMVKSGYFNMGDGYTVINHFFMNKINNNEDIYIKLEACNTGIIRSNGTSFAEDVAVNLRSFAKSKGYKGKIVISAPNGLSTFWHIGNYNKETVVKDRDKEAGYGKLPSSFGYNNF